MTKFLIASLVVLTSGIAFYFSSGFHDIWWLMWIAPIPVLIYAYHENILKTFLVAFIAGLAFGLNNIVGYWSTPIPANAFIPAMFYQSIEWTIVILLSRYFLRHIRSPLSIFAYPTCLALLEWLETFTIQGTFNTIAYSQLQILPVIQLASITGYIGISFLLGLFASTISFAIIFRHEKKKAFAGLVIGFLLVIISLIYGDYRLHTVAQEKPFAQIKVGLISVSRSPEKIVNPEMAAEIFSAYQPLMKSAVAKGAEVILLPEESFTVTKDSATIYKQKLAHFANQYNVKLIIGVRDHKNTGSYNSAWVFDEQGRWLGEYHKRHFVPVGESELTPGVDLLTFQIKENKSGIAVCRDMDYPKPASDYGALKTQILFVPAWDFDVDARVHASGAWMRGVEYGYTLVRSARDGFLSVSTPTGQIISKVSAVDSRGTVLIVTAPIYQNQSHFAAHPFWFVILLWLLLGAVVLSSRLKNL